MPKLYTKDTWTDEVLADDALYKITDPAGDPIPGSVTDLTTAIAALNSLLEILETGSKISLITDVSVAGTSLNAARMNNIEDGIDTLDDSLDLENAAEKETPTAGDLLLLADSEDGYSHKSVDFSNLGTGMPSGFLINGKIVPSVSSNNLTVAIKTLAGADPSAADPVRVRIGNVEHILTAALSVTKNAGTNWFNSGSTELATNEIDYFVYLGYNATDGVTIGFSRIPYAALYSDFSATTTNEKYCAISTITNAAAGDNYVNIGRFAATLSAGTGYTWTVPTFTARNLIQRPCYETRGLTSTCSVSSGSGTITSSSGNTNYYLLPDGLIFVQMNITITTNGSGGSYLIGTLPFTATGTGEWYFFGRQLAYPFKAQLAPLSAPNRTIAILGISDGSYPGADGMTLTVTGYYKIN